jgi:hypothetical protein
LKQIARSSACTIRPWPITWERTEPSPLAKRYAAMVVEIREALEANFREALDATEKGDYPRMVAAMKAKALLTQQAKGIVSARSLYVEQGEQEPQRARMRPAS